MKTPQFENWFDKIFYYLFKPIDLILGRNDQYYQSLALKGQISKGKVLKEFTEKKINERVVKITLVGFMEYSQEEYEKQKKKIEENRYYPYFQKVGYNLNRDIIQLFQIETLEKNYYVLAYIDVFDYEVPDKCIWLFKLTNHILTENLPDKDYVYYSNSLNTSIK